MTTFRALTLSVSVFAAIGHASAQSLPKTGSINWHTGWRSTGDVLEVGKGRLQGHGSVVGTTFNDSGSGPLHHGIAECVYVFSSSDGVGPLKGYCAFGDSDGDRIFTEFTGEGAAGTNVIMGGTGKYSGISGRGPWTSFSRGGHGGLGTTQRLDYRLP